LKNCFIGWKKLSQRKNKKKTGKVAVDKIKQFYDKKIKILNQVHA
jgi:hypothetical protein